MYSGAAPAALPAVSVLSAVPTTSSSAMVANSWSGDVNSALLPCANSLIDKSSGVSETVVKEALVCEMSPLGYHLSSSLKEKIWKHDYIDLLSLLPSAKEPSKSDKKI